MARVLTLEEFAQLTGEEFPESVIQDQEPPEMELRFRQELAARVQSSGFIRGSLVA